MAAGTDVKDKHEKTSLYFAASGRGNHTKTVEILIAEGTDENARVLKERLIRNVRL